MHQKLKWQNPLELAKRIADNYTEESWIFLYSALHKQIKNSFSHIALFPKKEIIADNFNELEKSFKNDKEKWFGYLSYEANNEAHQLKNSPIDLPKIWLINFSLILQFDHDKKELTAFFDDKEKLDKALNYKGEQQSTNRIKIKNINSNFSDESYLNEIRDIQKMIADGDFYQMNLTRKFFGKIDSSQENTANYFTLFSELIKLSPVNYSSFLSFKKNYIVSISPELFLNIDKNKIITSRPIKGTAARSWNPLRDKKNKFILQNSDKEKAENLMIVDLVRNDLSRVCDAKSVLVKNLFKITSYKNIHHMSSEIVGKISADKTIIDALKSCFPAGSMTGAPKIKTMRTIAQKEKINRGIYSGAIGFIDNSADNYSANLSVVIRTLVFQGNNFEFQSGGAITFDSDAKKELQEIFDKTQIIFKILKKTTKF